MRKKKKKQLEKTKKELVCVCAHAFRSQFHPIQSILGGIVSETAPFLDAIITQAAQGLRRDMLPYIEVLLINIDWSEQLEGVSVPISALHTVLVM